VKWGGLGSHVVPALVGLAFIACSQPHVPVREAHAASPPLAAATPASPPPDMLEHLQAGPLRLDADEQRTLARNGFVVTERKTYPTFADAWLSVYKADLPLFVSADALLHALHRSYDSILAILEQEVLGARLDTLLRGMRARLSGAEGAALSAPVRADVDVVTTVALRLLETTPAPTVVASNEALVAAIVEKAQSAVGADTASLFGRAPEIDWSQFRPRGHYAQGGRVALGGGIPPVSLAEYFRASMWLGRTDMRLTISERGGPQRLDRRALEDAYGVRAVMGEAEMAAWRALDTAMAALVGERDAAAPPDLDALARDLGAASERERSKIADARILQVLVDGHYGEQRILSQIVLEDPSHRGRIDHAFLLLGQRYTPDAHALSDLTADRVAHRLMPDPLDVAYTVLGNDDAKPLLAAEIARFVQPPALEPALAMDRARFDAAGPDAWQSSLYVSWVDALRALSHAPSPSLWPAVSPAPWGRRVLSSQLASWAELRHDTLLYAKQSYTSAFICSYPDARVDPYPGFYDALERLGHKGQDLARSLDFGGAGALRDRLMAYFDHFADVAHRLGAMARAQQSGEPLARADLAWINGAITEDPPGPSCGPPPRIVHGWFVDLYFNRDALTFAPTIADVHTQPTDEVGTPVGKVLHVGTGRPRLVVVNAGDSRHMRPYVGAVSMFAQAVFGNFTRVTDQDWLRLHGRENAEDVPWMRDVVVR
jgi:hypothetical protein